MGNGWVAWLALAVSLLALVLSLFREWRDSARVVTGCERFGMESDEPYLKVWIANAGRRPVTVHARGGPAIDSEDWTSLGAMYPGVKLDEGDQHSFAITADDIDVRTPYEEFVVRDVWFFSTLGKRYRVKNAKRLLARMAGVPPPPRRWWAPWRAKRWWMPWR